MSEVAEHFERMMDRMRNYVQPGPYTTFDGKIVSLRETQETEFINDMIYLLDGPEQRKASAELAFDYVAETDVTASGMDGRALVTKRELSAALKRFADAANELDVFKKVLFRGRTREDVGLGPMDLSTALTGVWNACDIDLLHGIVGVATESGELAEIAIAYLSEGLEYDPDDTNVREEVGDNLWYLARLVKWAGTTFPAEMKRNIAKLRSRHTEKGFDKERDINRDLFEERKVLEGECPTCNSPDPAKHPAVQFEGEVSVCKDAFHSSTTVERAPSTPWPGASPNKSNPDDGRPHPADPSSGIKAIFDKN